MKHVSYYLIQVFSLIRPKPKHYLTICCIIKDENDYIVERVNYHLKAGVEHFYIYDNDSKTSPEKTINEAGLSKFVTVIKIPGRSQQMIAYQLCLKKYGRESQWMAFLDMDEFIIAKATKGSLPHLLKSYESYGGLAINWQLFGSGYHIKKTHASQLERFVLRADSTADINRLIKSIVQPMYMKKVCNPHFCIPKKGYYSVNENFEPVVAAFSNVSVNKVQVNHYHSRSLEEFEEKIKRGYADDTHSQRSIDSFYHHEKYANAIEDKTILEIFAPVRYLSHI
jgi:hypothetical protein